MGTGIAFPNLKTALIAERKKCANVGEWLEEDEPTLGITLTYDQ
jgi:hypothetical protein